MGKTARVLVGATAVFVACSAPAYGQNAGPHRLAHLQVQYDAPDAGNRFTSKIADVVRRAIIGVAAVPIDAADTLLRAALPPEFRFNVNVKKCGVANAFYQEKSRRVVVCYELTAYAREVAQVWRDMDSTVFHDFDGIGGDFMTFAVLHEVGHALVHQLRLPLLGNAEDAADGFAVWASLREKNRDIGGVAVVLNAELWLLALQAKESEASGYITRLDDYASEHPFPGQRHARIMCYADGALSQPKSGGDDEAARCRREWETLDASWTALLYR